MSQVRVDESLLNDLRFRLLVRLLEEKDPTKTHVEAENTALAKCLRVYWLAQKYWRVDRSLIPTDIWSIGSFDDLVAAGLAKIEEGGVYVCGARDFFDWYHTKSEAGRIGGKKSGQTRKKTENSKKIVEANEAVLRSKRSKNDSASKHRTCSYSYSVPTLNLKNTPGPDDLAVARDWLAHASAISPTVKFSDKWPDTVRQLRELDGATIDDIRAVLAFVKTSDFWRVNALSLPGIRTKCKNGLSKFETIRLQIAKETSAAPAKFDSMAEVRKTYAILRERRGVSGQ